MSNSEKKKEINKLGTKVISIISIIIAITLIGVSIYQLYDIERIEAQLYDTNNQLDDLDSAWDDLLYLESRYDLIELKKVEYEVHILYYGGVINETQANLTIEAEAHLYGVHVFQTWGEFFRKNPQNSSQYLIRDEYKPFFYEVPGFGTYGIHFTFLEPVAGDEITPENVFPELENLSYSYHNETYSDFSNPNTIPLLRKENYTVVDNIVLPLFIRLSKQGDLYDPLNAEVESLESQLQTLRTGLTFNAIAVILISFLVDFEGSGSKLGLVFKLVFFILAIILLYFSLTPPI